MWSCHGSKFKLFNNNNRTPAHHEYQQFETSAHTKETDYGGIDVITRARLRRRARCL